MIFEIIDPVSKFQKCKNLNNVLIIQILCTKLLQKGGTIQGGTLFKEIWHLHYSNKNVCILHFLSFTFLNFFRAHLEYLVHKVTKVSKVSQVWKVCLDLKEVRETLDPKELEDLREIEARWACQDFLE